MPAKRRLLVTSALPYANGHIHIGHLVEYLQTDIWVRFQKLMGHHCVYICADDTHGTAISLRAQAEGRSEEAVIAEMSEVDQRDFAAFGIAFDHYQETNSPETRHFFCHEIWKSLRAAGLVVEHEVERLYDPAKGMFLSGRSGARHLSPVLQQAPARRQLWKLRGHLCSCGFGRCRRRLLSGSTPEVRRATHLFVTLEKERAFLEEWIQSRAAARGERPVSPQLLLPREGCERHPRPGNRSRTGTSPARRPTSASRFPIPRELLVCLVRCPDRLHWCDCRMV